MFSPRKLLYLVSNDVVFAISTPRDGNLSARAVHSAVENLLRTSISVLLTVLPTFPAKSALVNWFANVLAAVVSWRYSIAPLCEIRFVTSGKKASFTCVTYAGIL